MSYIFFQEVLAFLGKKINYESVSNMLGRTPFDKKAIDAVNKIVEQANPLTKVSTRNSAATLLSMPGTMAIIESGDKDSAKKAMGDMSWFEEYMK